MWVQPILIPRPPFSICISSFATTLRGSQHGIYNCHPTVELLGHGLYFLLFDDICSCRLICRSFTEISSPQLITRVVFGYTESTLSRLREISDHPYFHTYVTEPFHDTKWYELSAASDLSNYVRECGDTPLEIADEAPSAAELRELLDEVLEMGPRDDVVNPTRMRHGWCGTINLATTLALKTTRNASRSITEHGETSLRQ